MTNSTSNNNIAIKDTLETEAKAALLLAFIALILSNVALAFGPYW